MAVDRGGLQYTMEARDKFSKTTQSFRKEMRASKAAFRDFQNSFKVDKGAAKQLKQIADASRGLAAASKARTSATRKSTKVLTDAERQEKKFLATKQRILDSRKIEPRLIAEGLKKLKDEKRVLSSQEKTLRKIREAKVRILRQRKVEQALIDSGVKKLKQEKRTLTAVEEAQRRVARAIRERAIAASQVQQFRAQGQDALVTPGLLRKAGELQTTTKKTAKNASNIFFSFRRLVGILAVFTLARKTVQGFNELVVLGLRFGDTLESARTSIAGILLATGELRDEFGNAVEGVEALTRAEGIAGKQIRALRQDALATTATFEQLLDTFQIAVGPGLAAGLDLDEIRALSVDISQAATAIGLPQNQLAEEIRSLLSGTIQARTTRIATVLGISNADIKRLKETGELFDFLDEKFSSFADSAAKQARETLTGIQALVTGALGEVLGQAAAPLRNELIETLNLVLDDVLLIQDAAGNVAPRPEVVAAFRSLFDALTTGVQRARELGEELGFEGLEDVLQAAGAGLSSAIEFAFGFAEGLLATFQSIVGVVREISDLFGLTVRDLGRISGALGVVVATSIVWKNTLGLVGISMKGVLRSTLKLLPTFLRMAAVLGIVVGGVKLLVEQFTGLDLSVGNTISIIKLSFAELFGTLLIQGERFAKNLANSIVQFITDPIGFIANRFLELFGIIAGGAASLAALGVISEEARVSVEDTVGNLERLAKSKAEGSGFQVFSKEDLDENAQRLNDFLAESQVKFNALESDISGRDQDAEDFAGIGTAAQDAADSIDDATDSTEDFFGVLSTANQPISELAASLVKLQDELRSAQIEFANLAGTGDVQGTGGQIARLFTAGDLANAERLRKINTEIATTTGRISQLQKIQTTDGALNIQQRAELNSLATDLVDLQDASVLAQEEQLRLTISRAAILARQELPGLRDEARLLSLTAEAEERVSAAVRNKVGHRHEALIAAQNELATAQESARLEASANLSEIVEVRQAAAQATGEEKQELDSLVTTLEQRALLEGRIAEAKLEQLRLAQEEAALIANGTLAQGLREGFNVVLDELPSNFEAGIAIIKGSVQQLTSFISQEIVAAFDPSQDGEGEERFAKFLQGIATLILNQLIQLAVAAALQRVLGETEAGAAEVASASAAGAVRVGTATTIAGIETTTATTIAGIRLANAQAIAALSVTSGGLADGGLVPEGFNTGGAVRSGARVSLSHFSPNVKGYRNGGRPPGIDPRDTVPAFLQPGEFVIRKAVVDDLGLGFFENVNSGSFSGAAAPRSSPSPVAAANAGMASGGLVSDQVQRGAASDEVESSKGSSIVLPAIVAKEREMDRLMNGGKRANLTWFRENAGTLRSILEKGSR